jgi:hypothetical protein
MGTRPWDKIEKPDLSEAVNGWIARKDLVNWMPELFMSLHPEDEIADKIIFNHICARYKLCNVHRWAVQNILLQIRADWKPKTQAVKLRIVAGMLNALEKEKIITVEENIYMFNNIVQNLRDLRIDLIDSDLPF